MQGRTDGLRFGNRLPGDPDVGACFRIALQMIEQGHQFGKISLRAVVGQEYTVVDLIDGGNRYIAAKQKQYRQQKYETLEQKLPSCPLFMQCQYHIAYIPYCHDSDKRQDPDGILSDLPEKGKSHAGQNCPGKLLFQGKLLAQGKTDHAGKYNQHHSGNNSHTVQSLCHQLRQTDGRK